MFSRALEEFSVQPMAALLKEYFALIKEIAPVEEEDEGLREEASENFPEAPLGAERMGDVGEVRREQELGGNESREMKSEVRTVEVVHVTEVTSTEVVAVRFEEEARREEEGQLEGEPREGKAINLDEETREGNEALIESSGIQVVQAESEGQQDEEFGRELREEEAIELEEEAKEEEDALIAAKVLEEESSKFEYESREVEVVQREEEARKEEEAQLDEKLREEEAIELKLSRGGKRGGRGSQCSGDFRGRSRQVRG
eukprot:TRINITY_DN547_c0_g1_i6.p1 TRINITY_DN547_c0_g1~~TRINITY_DN547_c0_g1_i6.p1  ORF type:complete len:258 (-),score=95.24 TRINITY_DN547_c0_g1_i6:221-994(-)